MSFGWVQWGTATFGIPEQPVFAIPESDFPEEGRQRDAVNGSRSGARCAGATPSEDHPRGGLLGQPVLSASIELPPLLNDAAP